MKNEILKRAMRFHNNNETVNHINEVLINLSNIMAQANRDGKIIKRELIQTAALYHTVGSDVVRNEIHLRKYFSEDEIEFIATLCEGTSDANNIWASVLSDARSIDTIENIIKRERREHIKQAHVTTEKSVYYGVYDTLREKYGRRAGKGFVTKYASELIDLEEIYNVIEDESQFREVYYKSFLS